MVEGRNEELIRVYAELQQTIKGARRQLEVQCQILKNIHQVSISSSNCLVFNIHQLKCNSGILKLKTAKPGKLNLYAEKIGEGQFSFPDGSTVVVNRAGMITLESSNPEIPKTYVISVLEKALAGATETHFAGSEFFMKKNQFDVDFKTSVNEKLMACKIIKKILGISLREVKIMVDRAPGPLVRNVSKTLALQLKDELKKHNVAVHLRPIGVELQKMSTNIFYHHYINKFVEHIKRHAAQT